MAKPTMLDISKLAYQLGSKLIEAHEQMVTDPLIAYYGKYLDITNFIKVIDNVQGRPVVADGTLAIEFDHRNVPDTFWKYLPLFSEMGTDQVPPHSFFVTEELITSLAIRMGHLNEDLFHEEILRLKKHYSKDTAANSRIVVVDDETLFDDYSFPIYEEYLPSIDFVIDKLLIPKCTDVHLDIKLSKVFSSKSEASLTSEIVSHIEHLNDLLIEVLNFIPRLSPKFMKELS
jgi:hypothetical protein